MILNTQEEATAKYSAVIQDELLQAVPVGEIDQITLTLWDVSSKRIINNRRDQDVKNLNGVTIDGSGNISWIMSPADNVIINKATLIDKREQHKALFTFLYDNRAKQGRHELDIRVLNLGKVGT